MSSVLIGTFGALIIIVVSASGSFMPAKYLDPWNKNYAAKFDDPRVQVAAQALLAPNGHNMQPWKIKLDSQNKDVFYLFGDPERLTPEIDPPARQFTVTQGTFLGYARVAAGKMGYKTDIVFFPNGEYDEQGQKESILNKPVAKITLQKNVVEENPLYDAMFMPDTNRSPYKPDSLNSQQTENLLAQNHDDNDLGVKIYQEPEKTAAIKKLALQAMDIETNVHRINALNSTLVRVNEYQKNQFRYGFALDSQGTSGPMLHVMQSLLTIAPMLNSEQSSRDLVMKNTRAALDATPAYLIIATKDNSRTSQVKSGMLYSRILLTARTMGFVMQPLSQCLEEYPEMKDVYQQAYAALADKGETLQMLTRIGKPTREDPRTMRRDVLEIIE